MASRSFPLKLEIRSSGAPPTQEALPVVLVDANGAPATLGGGGETIYGQIRRLHGVARNRNPHLLDPTTGVPTVMSSPPTLNLAPGYANGAAAIAAGYSQAIIANTAGAISPKFTYTGGAPYSSGSNGYVALPCVTQYATGAGSVSSNPARNAYGWRVHFRTDAPIFCFGLVYGSPFRLLVNGQYASVAPSTGPLATPSLVVVDFTSVGGRAMRDIAIEMSGGSFQGVWLKPTDSFEKKTWADPLRAAYYGDSISTGSNASFMMDCFAHVCGDYLGIPDNWQVAIGATGYGVGVANTSYAAEQHVFDVTNNNFDVVFLTHNVNSYKQAADGLTSWTNVARPAFLSVYNQIRAWRPTVPIFQIGVIATSLASSDAYAAPYETAQAADVAALAANDPNLFYVPIVTAVTPWITGSGYSSALANNGNRDLLYDQAGPHPNTRGHQQLGMLMAAGVINAIAAAA